MKKTATGSRDWWADETNCLRGVPIDLEKRRRRRGGSVGKKDQFAVGKRWTFLGTIRADVKKRGTERATGKAHSPFI